MNKLEKIVNRSAKVKDVLEQQFNLGYTISSISLRKGDVLVNGTRVKQNVDVKRGDLVCVYYKDKEYAVDKIYEDENILIVNKSKKIEVVAKESECLTSILQKEYAFIKPCHRIDFNTTGLVVFAKNTVALEEILLAFKEERVLKIYEAIVVGTPKQSENLVAYLKKDSEKSYVFVSSDKTNGDEIRTDYTLIKQINPELALIAVTLHNGKTHQIRAHMSYAGYPVLGDDKYGTKQINRKYKIKSQCLVAEKIGFNFNSTSVLYYLNNKVFKINGNLERLIEEKISK